MATDRRALLGALLADPASVRDLSPETAAGLLGDLAAVQAAVAGRLTAAQPPREQHPGRAVEDRLLSPQEAAAVLGVKVRWLYRHASQLPFTVRLSRKVLRFSECGVRRFMARKGLAGAGAL